MKLIAHRGWAAGADENTLSAFARAAGDARIGGVEFDVCRAADTGALVVSHDPPSRARDAPGLDDALAALAGSRLELLVEIKQAGLAQETIAALVARKLAERAVLFAFVDVARSFAWRGARPVRLGVIETYPWRLPRTVRELAPDVLMLGWDERAWTRAAFRGWWSVFSLHRLGRRHGVPVVAGIVRRTQDLRWLERQSIDAAVADMDCLPPSSP